MRLFTELKRRNVLRMAALYIVAAWLVIQVATALIDLSVLPDNVGPWVMVALVIGFPIALVVSWFFDITPEGVVRESEVPEGQPILAAGGRRTDFIIIAMLAAAIILMLVWEPPASADDALTILPFESMTGPDEARFSEGLSIELLNLVAQLRRFKVKQPPEASILARFSDIPTLAREMDVRWVLKGSVRHAEQRVRIAVQLIDADDDASIAWSNVFDRELSAKNLFGIQAEIARSIAGELRQSLDEPAERRLAAPPTQNTEAYTAYLIGRRRLTDRRVDWLEDAIEQFALAIDLDPEFGEAYAGLADACGLYEGYSGEHRHERCPDDAAGRVALARKAVRLEPESGEAWVSLALKLARLIDDWQSEEGKTLAAEADSAFQRGLALNPAYSQGYHWYGLFLGTIPPATRETWLETWRDGVGRKVYEHGLEVDPLSVQLHYMFVYPYVAKSRDEALLHARRIIEIAPDSPRGYARLAEFRWNYSGRVDEAVRLANKASELDPQRPYFPELIGHAYTALGDFDMALAYFRRARALSNTGANTRTSQDTSLAEAMTLLYAGNKEEAVERLEALQERGAEGPVPFITLSDLDLAAGQPEKALERYRQHAPECFAEPESAVNGIPQCPAFSFVRILQELGDDDRAQQFIEKLAPRVELEKKYWSDLEYDFQQLLYSGYDAIAGRPEKALAPLEHFVEQGWRGYWEYGSDWRWIANYDSLFDAIRGHPRFQSVVAVIEADMAQQLENVRTMQRRGEVPTLEEVNASNASE